MSYVRSWHHIVWAVKDGESLLDEEVMPKVLKCLKSIANENSIEILEMNGHEDHIHLLVKMKPAQQLSNILKLLKGASSRWINKRLKAHVGFRWQSEYFAESVSPKELWAVRKYIRDQNIIHQRFDHLEEMRKLKRRHDRVRV